MTTRILLRSLPLAMLGLLGFQASAHAQDLDGDIRIGLYSDASELFVGGGLETAITNRWSFNPNVEWAFVDEGDLATLNADFLYNLAGHRGADFWLGGGPALVFRENRFGNDETDFGVNLLGGVGFLQTGYFRPYFQVKVILADETEGVIAFGLKFD